MKTQLNFLFIYLFYEGAGAMTHWLRALAALQKTHQVQQQALSL